MIKNCRTLNQDTVSMDETKVIFLSHSSMNDGSIAS